jgi:hypothetical protein
VLPTYLPTHSAARLQLNHLPVGSEGLVQPGEEERHRLADAHLSQDGYGLRVAVSTGIV